LFYSKTRDHDPHNLLLPYHTTCPTDAGNEAPVDVYVNNTGLIWDLAPRLGALVVFAEHRFFGKSIPPLAGKANCLSTLTATQALADFAEVVRVVKQKFNLGHANKVVAFGGSYGGMLAAWFRFKYPHVCTGGGKLFVDLVNRSEVSATLCP
jgi:pimeloyl-ACP methyl ester carboxylesterase